MAVLNTIQLRTRNIPSGIAVPITTGIPFARSIVNDPQYLSLTENGVEIPAQFSTARAWRDGSDCVTHVSALWDPSKNYQLVINDLIQSVYSPAVSAPTFDGDVYIVIGGVTYTVGNDAAKITTTEVSGPLFTIRKITGVFTSSGAVQALGGRARFIIRVTAYRNQSYKDVDITFEDGRDGVRDSPNPFNASEYGYTIPKTATNYVFGADVANQGTEYQGSVTGTHRIYQTGQLVFNGAQLTAKRQSYSGVGSGARAQGWVSAYSSSDDVLTVIFQDFWEQLPKQLDVTATTVGVRFHPAQYVTDANDPSDTINRNRNFYSPDTGMAKTYRLRIDRSALNLPRLRLLQQAFNAMVRVEAPSAQYTSSRFIGDLKAASVTPGVGSFGYDKLLIDSTYDPAIQQGRDNPTNSKIAYLPFWRDFGDSLRPGSYLFGYNGTHDNPWGDAVEYVRNIGVNDAYADKWFWQWVHYNRHWYDIDVSHGPRSGYWAIGTSVGPGEGFAEGHATNDHVNRNFFMSHVHSAALSLGWLLLADRRSKDVLDKVRNWWKNLTPVQFPLSSYGDNTPHTAEEHRSYGWPLITQIHNYFGSGDVQDLTNALRIIDHCLLWWQTPPTVVATSFGRTLPYNHHYQHGVDLGPNDWQADTGFMYCYPSQDNKVGVDFGGHVPPIDGQAAFISNGPSPWMLFPLLAGMILFLAWDEFGLADQTKRNLIWRCILQHLNYLFKPTCYDAVRRDFRYAEGYEVVENAWDAPTSRLCAHFVVGAAIKYLATASTAEVPNQNVYDTRTAWQAFQDEYYLAQRNANPNPGVMDANAQSKYGYETEQPADSWEMDDKQRVPITGLAYGEKIPMLGEAAANWVGWLNSIGGAVPISGDANYGSVSLDSDGRAYGPVRGPLGVSGVVRQFLVSRGKYRGGQGKAELWIRGQETSFSQTALTPKWERYTGPINRQWNYVQMKIQKPWALTFGDDFNGSAGAAPNPAYWFRFSGTGAEHPGTLHYDLESNCVLDGNGSLVQTARFETVGGKPYTSSRVAMYDAPDILFGQIKGAWESRMKLPTALGVWAAYWLNCRYWMPPGWPSRGEVDIAEKYGVDPANSITANIIDAGPEFLPMGGGTVPVPGGGLVSDWHDWRFELTDNLALFMCDGWEIARVFKSQVDQWRLSPFTYDVEPLMVVYTFEIGNGGGTPNPADYPQVMTTDYSRIFAQVG